MYDYQETYKQHILVSYGWQSAMPEKKNGVKFVVFVYREDDFKNIPTPCLVFQLDTFFSGPRKEMLESQGKQELIQAEKDHLREQIIKDVKKKIDSMR